MQVTVREVQIDGGMFQVRVSQQQLNGSQISPCLHVVRRKTVSQGVRSNPFLDAGPNGCPFANVPNRLVGDGPFRATMTGGAWEQIKLGLLPAPIFASGLQEFRTQRNIAVA